MISTINISLDNTSDILWLGGIVFCVIFIFWFFVYRIKTKDLKLEKHKLEKEVELRLTELKEANAMLEERQEEIQRQNEEIIFKNSELETHRQHLERMVGERTKQLLDAKIKLEETDQLKTSFLTNLSHEIRTPMNAILGFSTLLTLDDGSNKENKDLYLKQITLGTDTLLRLIEDILDISKIEANQIEITKTEFAVLPLLRELHDFFSSEKHNMERSKIDLRLEAKEDIQIISDRQRVRQILYHLIHNALKYTEVGYVKFGYSIVDDRISFYVKDSGIGIAKEHLAVIFENFRKIEDQHEKLYRGTGLGLAISRNLVNLLDGEIRVDSRVNFGSSFYFSIPYGSIHLVDNEIVKKDNDTLEYNWKGKRILIVEDEDINLMFLKIMLNKTNADILWVKDGKAAVELCTSDSTIDMVLMDIKLPEMDGIEATRKIKAHRKDLPIIAQTAYAMPKEREEIIEAGCDEYMAKPLQINVLFDMINRFFIANEYIS